jgi:hypothetical protein
MEEDEEVSPFPCGRVEAGSNKEAMLLELSDPKTLRTVEELESRLSRIRQLFASEGDRRGIFSSIYHEVSKGALAALKSGTFKKEKAVRRVIVEFGRTYLNALFGHLKGTQIKEEWAQYFDQASQCDIHPLKTCSTAMNTHIVLDLVDALLLAEVDSEFFDEYMLLGDGLVERIPNVAQALEDDFGVPKDEALGFFRGWMAGSGVNIGINALRKAWHSLSFSEEKFEEEDVTGRFNMQFLRKGAWTDAAGQAPWMKSKPRGGHALRNYKKAVQKARAKGKITPEQTTWMSVKWKAYQGAFSAMGWFIDEDNAVAELGTTGTSVE